LDSGDTEKKFGEKRKREEKEKEKEKGLIFIVSL